MLISFYMKIFYKIIELIDYPNKKKIMNFFKNNFLKKKLIAIDVGSHRGETVDIINKNFSIEKIYSFEPNNDLFSELKKNKNYKDMNIEFFNYALGEKKENKDIKIYKETSSSGFHDLNYESQYYKRKKKILDIFSKTSNLSFKKQSTQIISLSDFFLEKNIKKIDLLKIDAEGYEYNILKGLNNLDFKKIDLIYFEHHYNTMLNKNYTFSMINHLLKKNNFSKVFKIKMKLRKSFEYIYKNSKNIY